ncbi:putative RNA-dependent RNA polymerase [Cryphonectria parasitica sclerotimonavirus 1]|uniref:RNA-directed RNA polymerase n=1 Tax=Cryphonectria parasitica sclerotimonavirus 1 TaxID=2755404 RepID=A0AAE7IFW3_9MONO|nr:putative RNA-dependent RNA polymerase [Cryphonectria parasitica sclerotimonavirus 1]QMP84020.1 putative RNA-dependent RNA polymerase [Cryphonectria parasitica sclerotimonavirus 1]
MDASTIFDDDDSPRARASAPAEKHLQSPILSSLLDRLISLYGAVISDSSRNRFNDKKIACIPSDSSLLLHKICRSQSEYSYANLERIALPYFECLAGTTQSPKILTPDLYPECFSRSIATRSIIDSCLEQSKELYREEIKAFKTWAKTEELQRIAEIEEQADFNLRKDTYELYESYRYWDLVVERYRARKQQSRFGKDPLKIKDSTFFFFDGFVMEQRGEVQVIRNEEGRVVKRIAPTRYIITYEQLQMIQDALLARFNSFLALDAGMHNGTRSLKRYLKELLQWQENVLVAYGNKGYDLVKGPESVTKSYLTSLSDGDVMPVSSFVRTVVKLREKELKLSSGKSHALVDRLVEIIEQCDNYNDTAELFGCTKLSGHPFVYASISALSVKEEGCPSGNIDLIAIRDHHNHFKQMVLARFLEKHQVWPPFAPNKSPKEGTRLHDLWKRHMHHLTSNAYPVDDLTDVEFGKFMEFDYSPDYLDMIDDKAINPGAQHASDFWHKQPTPVSRRLLENLIQKPDIDTVEIVDRMRHGLFHPNERIIELTQKEREFKTSARCFCKLTFEVRLFFVLTETNLKRFMGGDSGDNGYLPQQTMTMSNTKMRKRLYDMTSGKIRENSCIVEIDFSRWNLRWRASTVNPISRTLENIFGLPGVFSQAHNFFTSSTIVLTDKHTRPPGVRAGLHASLWPESDLVWRNHLGGFEGIQQTLWTICTLAMMYFALRNENCSFKMAGQGDNQVFHLTFNKTTCTLSSLLLDLLKSIERECERLNHEVKPEECIDSMTVLTYGKEIYIRGVHVLYSLKFSSRAFARADYTTPSLTKEIASIVANSVAVSGTLNNSLRAIWWKHIQCILLLNRRLSSPIYSDEHSGIKRLLKNRNSRSLLLIPGSLGGLPMMPWTRYFSKGETDDLSFDCAATYYLSKNNRVIRNYMSLLLKGDFTSRKVDVTNLINDPHSIPIDRPNDASHLISDAVATRLPEIVKNKDLRQLVSPTLRVNGEKFKELLVEMRPLHPDIVSDLFALTPAGLYNKTVKRFSMTRTIEKLVPGLNLSHKISQASALILSVLLNRIVSATKHEGISHPPPFETASRLRTMWGCDIKNSSVGIYTPFDFEIGPFSARKATISASVIPSAQILTTCGESPPNFGTVTRQKLSSHGYRIVNCNSTMRDLKQAVVIYSELQADSTISPIVDSVVTARSPWSLSQLTAIFPSVYGGTAVHRHAASKHHFSMLGSCSIPTHLTFSSDRAGILSGGELDYPVVFQTLFLTLSNLYQNIAASGVKLPTNIAYYIPDTLNAIDTEPTVSRKPYPSIQWPNLSNNRLAFVNKMFASEVPTVPDPQLIPHITRASNSIDLIYSYLDCVVSSELDKSRLWDPITSARDIFEFKEISRVNPYDVEEAIEWAIITDIFYEALGNSGTNQEQLLKKALKRRSVLYAGAWVRVRLHPMFSDSEYNHRRQIAMIPGSNGYKRPVEYIASIFRRDARHLLQTQGGGSIPKLILFDNWKSTSVLSAKRRITLSHVLATYPSIARDELIRSIYSVLPPKELLDNDPATAIHVATRPTSRRIANRDYDLPEVPCRFFNASPEEAMRSLRDRRPADIKAEVSNKVLNIRNHGILKYTSILEHGSLMPEDESLPVSALTRIRTLRRRKLGCYSPLFSDWLAVLTHLRHEFTDKDGLFHLFGVGRGANARVLCQEGFRSLGYDLQSSFPVIPHRSSSYVPPEVALSGRPELFSWSDHTYNTDGNVLEGNLDLQEEDESIALVDMDMKFSSLVTFLARLPIGRKTLVRHRGTTDQVKYLISLLCPDKIYVLVAEDQEPRDVVLYMRNLQPIGSGNYKSIEITSCSEIQYHTMTTELVQQFWNCEYKVARHNGLEYEEKVEAVAAFLDQLTKSVRRSLVPSEQDLFDVLHRGDIHTLTGKQLRTLAICKNILEFLPV